MHGNTLILIMERQREEKFRYSAKKKTEDIKLPQLDKKALQQKVRSTLYKHPIIPFLFYGLQYLS